MWLGNRYYRNFNIAISLLCMLFLATAVGMLTKVVEIPTALSISLNVILLIIMIWQSLRQTHNILVLPNITIFGIRKGAGPHANEKPVRAYAFKPIVVHWAIRRPLVNMVQFEPMDHYVVRFDIGNAGLNDYTLHEYYVEKEEPSPSTRVTELKPLLDGKGERKLLHKGERHTVQFDLQIQDNCLTIFRICIVSVGLVATRRLYVLKKGNGMQYFDVVAKFALNRKKIERTLLANS